MRDNYFDRCGSEKWGRDREKKEDNLSRHVCFFVSFSDSSADNSIKKEEKIHEENRKRWKINPIQWAAAQLCDRAGLWTTFSLIVAIKKNTQNKTEIQTFMRHYHISARGVRINVKFMISNVKTSRQFLIVTEKYHFFPAAHWSGVHYAIIQIKWVIFSQVSSKSRHLVQIREWSTTHQQPPVPESFHLLLRGEHVRAGNLLQFSLQVLHCADELVHVLLFVSQFSLDGFMLQGRGREKDDNGLPPGWKQPKPEGLKFIFIAHLRRQKAETFWPHIHVWVCVLYSRYC